MKSWFARYTRDGIVVVAYEDSVTYKRESFKCSLQEARQLVHELKKVLGDG